MTVNVTIAITADVDMFFHKPLAKQAFFKAMNDILKTSDFSIDMRTWMKKPRKYGFELISKKGEWGDIVKQYAVSSRHDFNYSENLVEDCAICIAFLGPGESNHPLENTDVMETIRNVVKNNKVGKVYKLIGDKFQHQWSRFGWWHDGEEMRMMKPWAKKRRA